MKFKKPMVGFEPTTGRLRSDYSTPELHRPNDYYKRIVNTLVARLTLAIIPLRIPRVKHFSLPRQAFHTFPYNKVIQ